MVNLQDEIDSAALYQALAQIEPEKQVAEIYSRMAKDEKRHAEIWEQKLRTLGYPAPSLHPGWRPRLLIVFAKLFGPNFILPVIATMETIGHPGLDMREDDDREEKSSNRSHARALRAIQKGSREGLEGSALARIEGRHHAIGGNALRAAVLGANDGLVSNFSLIMGVTGAEFSEHSIVITGFAGLLAGAASMAMGEWISVQSSRELSQRQIDIEADEIAEMPEEEKEELSLIFQDKGLSIDDARTLAEDMMRDKDKALDTLVREELGIDPKNLGGSAWTAAAASFLLFALGAAVPLLPFVAMGGNPAIFISLGVSAMTLFLFGAAVTLLTGRGVLRSGLRQLGLGLTAAAVTYGVGRLVGIILGG